MVWDVRVKYIRVSDIRIDKLGPILWIVYYNDIIVDLESEVLIFADDICNSAKGNTHDITTQILNTDLERISLWATK